MTVSKKLTYLQDFLGLHYIFEALTELLHQHSKFANKSYEAYSNNAVHIDLHELHSISVVNKIVELSVFLSLIITAKIHSHKNYEQHLQYLLLVVQRVLRDF